MENKPIKFHVIDDNEVSRSYLKLIINRTCPGSDVLLFEQAEYSLQEINNGNLPNFVFCDLNMPKMDGLEYLTTLNEILISKKNPLFPIIIVTSANVDGTKHKFTNVYENCEVFIKPLMFNQVSDLLNKLEIIPKTKDLDSD